MCLIGKLKHGANPGKKTICLLPIGEDFLLDDEHDKDGSDGNEAGDMDENSANSPAMGGRKRGRPTKQTSRNSPVAEYGRISRRAIRRYTEAYFHGK